MTSQTTTPRRRVSIGGTGFLLIVAFATIVTVAAEAAFVSAATWALLPVIMAFVIVMAVGVVSAAARLVEHGEVASAALPDVEPEPEPQRTPAPVVGRRAALAHQDR